MFETFFYNGWISCYAEQALSPLNRSLSLLERKPKAIKLRYDGRYDFCSKPRQWTVMSHFIDKYGQDRYHGSFSLEGLKEIGILKGGK